MPFFRAFHNSLWNLTWLKQQKNADGKAWGYFSLLVLLVTLVAMLPVLFFLPSAIREVREALVTAPDFEAAFMNGRLSVSGLDQPFIVTEERNGTQSMLVIDTVTTSTVSAKSFLTTSTELLVLITSDRLEIFDPATNRREVQEWGGVPDFSINKTTLVDFFTRFTSPWPLFLILVLIALALYAITFISKLWSIFVVSLLVWLIARLSKQRAELGALITIGLYAVTLPTIISLLFTLFGIMIPFVHFLALLAFMLAIVFTSDGSEKKIDTRDISV